MNEQRTGRPLALVTGATGAIGGAIARQLAVDHGFRVLLVCRDAGKAEAAVRNIGRATGNVRAGFELADVARKASLRSLAERVDEPVHLLINNAAATPPVRQETPEGIEVQFATNVLGYFWMIRLFAGHLKRAGGARVVNVASYWAGGLDPSDLEFRRRRYDNDQAYRQSKQADRMLTAAFAERLEPFGVAVNACHPGDVNSVLSNNLGFGGHETPDQGACTPVWLATGSAGGRLSGKYFERRREVGCRFSRDRKAVEALFGACERY